MKLIKLCIHAAYLYREIFNPKLHFGEEEELFWLN